MTGGLLAKQMRPLGALAPPGEADAFFGARLRFFAAVCVAAHLRSLPPSLARVTWTAWSGHDQEAAGVRIDSGAYGFGVFARR